MTNEEKALQLAGLKETPDEEERYYNPFNCKIYDKCLEIAAWKEQQMIEWLDKNAWKYARDHQEVDTDKMIEDFKKAMEV